EACAELLLRKTLVLGSDHCCARALQAASRSSRRLRVGPAAEVGERRRRRRFGAAALQGDDVHFLGTRHHHLQIDACGLLHTTMPGPRALLEPALSPFDVERIARGSERLQLDEEAARLMLAPHHRDARTEQREPQQRKHCARSDAHAALLSATRMIALRARGLAAVSAALGCTARPMRRSLGRACMGMSGKPAYTGSSCECFWMKRFTIASSKEWKLMTHSRPRGASASRAASSAAASCVSSWFTWMRIAWNVRVAGCLPGSRVGTERAVSSASCAVRSIGCTRRSATMARAIRLAKRSSPYSRITRSISRSVACARNCAAVGPPEASSIRMSSGPSCAKLKPRAGSSSCGEDTPRSSNTPSIPPATPNCAAISPKRANG